MTIIAALDTQDGIDATGRPNDRSDASPDVSRAVHADAVILAGKEFRNALTVLTIVAITTFFVSRSLLVLPFAPIAMLAGAWVIRSGIALVRLRRVNPALTLQREHEEEIEQAAAVADFRERSAAVTPWTTYGLMAVITLVTAAEAITGVTQSVNAAGLVKPAVRSGEWWRLLSASYLHGSLMHLLANMAGLRVLGHMIEIYDRPSRIPLVYVASAIGGSVASTLLSAAPSVGASGGILGLAGYLMAVGGRAPAGAPAWVRMRMMTMLATTALAGVVYFFVIDNAGHLGGVLTGAFIGIATVRRSAERSSSRADRVIDALSWFAMTVLVAGAVFTTVRLTR